ncbi:MAG: excinuclease ABC subunit UvrC [Firmicutes bacterium]|nr:excinuclease ABC subunit UvrC [Bacillota bacterium]
MQKIQEKLALAPHKPGVYLMRDIHNHIIYVGKAKDLKNRLSSYFKSSSHDQKVTAMLQHVTIFDYFITRTENDALALESNLIKKHQPHYNILLKDSKTFPYIKIVGDDFPYLEVTRKIENVKKNAVTKSQYFGPYFNGIWARELLNTLCDIFPLRTCSKPEFTKSQKSKTPCLNYQMKRCIAPCQSQNQDQKNLINCKIAYAKIIADVRAFLRGESTSNAAKILTEKMENAASLEQFETAIRYRDGLAFLDKLKERTIADTAKDLNADIFAYAIKGDIFVTSVLTVRAGKLIGIQNFSTKNPEIESEPEMLGSFVLQYYQQNIVPDEIIMSQSNIDDHKELSELLGCKITSPKIAYKKKLLDMAIQNAQEYMDTSIEQIKHKQDFTTGACEELGKILGMTKLPKKIECFDISHTAGEEQVASMTVFIDGIAARKLYRRFKIKHEQGNNDYLSLQEVVRRRLARIGTSDPSFGTAPDLMVIDGGKGQLSAILDLFNELENNATTKDEIPQDHPLASYQQLSDITLISLAEENEEIFTPHSNTPIILSKRSYALRLLQRIRDEAHRFAITYHRKLRGNAKIPNRKFNDNS